MKTSCQATHPLTHNIQIQKHIQRLEKVYMTVFHVFRLEIHPQSFVRLGAEVKEAFSGSNLLDDSDTLEPMRKILKSPVPNLLERKRNKCGEIRLESDTFLFLVLARFFKIRKGLSYANHILGAKFELITLKTSRNKMMLIMCPSIT